MMAAFWLSLEIVGFWTVDVLRVLSDRNRAKCMMHLFLTFVLTMIYYI